MKLIKIAAALAAVAMLVSCSSGADTSSSLSATSKSTVSTKSAKSETASKPVIPEVNDYKTYTYKTVDIADYINFSARSTTVKNGISFDNAGCSIHFVADCEGDVKVTVLASPVNVINHADRFYTAYVDGKRTDRLTVNAILGTEMPLDITVATGLERGKHDIKLCRATPSEAGSETVTAITVNGVPCERPEDAAMYIEFVGDSITAGLDSIKGVEGKDRYSTNCSDAYQTYAGFTAEALGADLGTVCRGGQPFSFEYYSSTIEQLYLKYSQKRDLGEYGFSRKATAVVINLGTNDFGPENRKKYGKTDDEIKASAVSFIKLVRQKNPDAKIVWAYGMLGTTGESIIKSAITEAGGEAGGIYYCRLPGKSQGESGHPNVQSHMAAAETLTTFLKGII